MNTFILTYCTLALLVCFPNSAQQRRGLVLENTRSEQRFALVIGNSDYEAAPLKNPVNDANDVAQTLRGLGFEVIYKENVGQVEMKRAIRLFGDKIRNGGIGLFYFAGHGLQVKGLNYLVPVDVKLNNEEEVEYECIEVGFVLAQMESARNDMNILILDACRNNPFARAFRSTSRGLAPINAPTGTLIAYATGPGSVASDGNGRNGIYTQELLRNIRTPDLGIEEVFKRIRISVIKLTQGKQTPWESSSLTRDFYFAGSKVNSQPAKNELPISPSVDSDSTSSGKAKIQGQIVKNSFFTFDLQQCNKSGSIIICDLVITNQDKDRRLVFGDYNSTLFDDMGNAGKIKNVSLGNQTGMYYATNLMVSGVPTKARIGFEGISPQATKISLMTIRCFASEPNSYPPDMFEIQFRSVPLDK